MGLLNPSKPTKKTTASSPSTADKVKALAASGNKAAQAYIAGGGKLDGSTKVTTTPTKTVTGQTPVKYTTPTVAKPSGVAINSALAAALKTAGIDSSDPNWSTITGSSGNVLGKLNVDALNKIASQRAGTGITSDSTAAVNEENAMQSDINSLLKRSGLAGTVDSYIDPLLKLQGDQLDQIEKERTALETRRANELAGIETGYQVAKTGLEGAQTAETGSTSMALATAGGYLGVTASQNGVLQSLVQAQRQEMFALQAQKDDALRMANNAYEDRDFELVRESLTSARDLESQIFDRRKTFLDQQLSILGEQRAQAQEQRLSKQFVRDAANERIDRLITAGINPSTTDILAISRDIGMSPDEVKRMFDAAKSSKALEEKTARTERDVAIVSALRGVPRDKTVVIDGVTYRGLAELDQSASAAAAGATATERERRRLDAVKAQLMRNIDGYDADGNKVEPITLEKAIKEYPDLSEEEVQNIFYALEDAQRQGNVQSGSSGVQTVYDPETNKPIDTIVYNKEDYKKALEQWQKDSTDRNAITYIGKSEGKDKTITVDGVTYVGNAKNEPSIYSYRINKTYGY